VDRWNGGLEWIASTLFYSDAMTALTSFIEDHYFRLNPRIRSEHTRNQYRFAIKDLAESLGRVATFEDLTDDSVAGMMAHLQRKGLAPKTINERRGRIHALWSWMAKRGLVRTWPTTPKIPEPVRIPRGWSRTQLNVLFGPAFERERVAIGGVPAPLWWKSLHFVEWDSGERISALLACEWTFLDDGWLLVPAEVRKGQKRDMAYRLSSDTIALLSAIREPGRKFIWPWPYTPNYLWTRYKIIRQRAGLPTDRRSAFHRMRKSVASYYEAAGGNATELFQHTSRRVTMQYIDPTICPSRQASDILFRPAENLKSLGQLIQVSKSDIEKPNGRKKSDSR
jgi:integrase